MSIVRFSCLKTELYAPTIEGTLVKADYANGVGRLGAFAQPDKPGDKPDLLVDYLRRSVRTAAKTLPADANAPLVILVHGFLFDPDKGIGTAPETSDNPHGRLYHFVDVPPAEAQREHTTSWPRGLGFTNDDTSGSEGLVLAYGWLSQPGFAKSLLERFQNFYARAYEYAEMSAWPLLRLLIEVQNMDLFTGRLANKRFDIFAHSLGARVVVRMIAELAKAAHKDNAEYKPAVRSACRRLLDRLGRVVLLGGSEYVVEAQLMYQRLERLGYMEASLPRLNVAAAGPTFYNIACRENDVLDLLAENFGPRTFGDSQVIGHNGLGARARAARWIDLQIDRGALQGWMRAAPGNLEISGDEPGHVWDHWYYFTNPGNMKFYRDILRNRERWDLDHLRSDRPEFPDEKPIPEGVREGVFGD